MKAQELRIGNLVNDPGKNGFGAMRVESILSGTLRVYLHTLDNEYLGDFALNAIEPIPLTSEWLERFGFTFIKESVIENLKMSYWAKDALLLFVNESPPENTYLVGYGFNIGGNYYAATNRWIDTVHELQNVYHAYRGSELTIKETVQ